MNGERNDLRRRPVERDGAAFIRHVHLKTEVAGASFTERK